MTTDENTKRLRELKSYAVEEMGTAPPGMCGVSADVLYDMIVHLEALEAENTKLKSQCAELIALCKECITEAKASNASLRSILSMNDWVCPLGDPNCKSNCGNYGCGN